MVKGLLEFVKNAFQIDRTYVPSTEPGEPFFVDSSSPDALPIKSSVVPVVYAAINLMTNTMAGLPKSCAELNNPLNEFFTDLPDHPITTLLNSPNSTFDAWQFWQFVFCQLYTHGNAYIRIRRDYLGNPIELIPVILRQCRTGVTGTRRRMHIRDYFVSDIYDLDFVHILRPRDIITLHGDGFNGVSSLSPVMVAARKSLEVIAEADAHILNALRKGINLQAAIVAEAPELASLELKEVKTLVESIKESYTGSQSKGEIPVLPPGFTIKTLTGLSHVDLQLLDLLKWNSEDVFKIWNIPPRMLHYYHAGVRNVQGVEQHAEDFAKWTIAPEAKRVQTQLTAKLLTVADVNKNYQCRLHVERVGEGSWSNRVVAVELAVTRGGLLTPNEGRERLGYPPVAGGDEIQSPKGAPEWKQGSDGDKSEEEDEGQDKEQEEQEEQEKEA